MRLARLCLVPPVFLLATCTSPAVAPPPSPAATETIDEQALPTALRWMHRMLSR